MANGRLATGLLALGGGLWALAGSPPAGTGVLAALAAAAFLVLVKMHERVEREADWQTTVAGWHEEQVARLARHWTALPVPPESPPAPRTSSAEDLDLFGPASLEHLIGPPGTASGRAALHAWLAGPAAPDEIRARQAAVAELASARTFREALAGHARRVGRDARFDLGRFLAWAEGGGWFRRNPVLVWVARLVPVSVALLVLLQAAGVVDGGWWVIPLATGLGVSWGVRHRLDEALGPASAWEPVVRAYVDLLRTAESATFTAPRLTALRAALGDGAATASSGIARFQRLVAFADLRHAPLLHFPVHALTLYDLHVWWGIDGWRRTTGAGVRRWLEVVGELEALSALATLADDHPSWTLPSVEPGRVAFEATDLVHPLLPPDRAVANDVRVGPAGRVLCVTGSNMSGKSTLLRAIGVNAVLAQAGGVVAARALAMPPATLHTSLRLTDSLSDGVSFFMAALGRLKTVVAAADEAARRPGAPTVLYLLDEILQGTNSAEREIAVRLVLRHLLATPAIGAITTHDLALTGTPELAASGDHVHFRETIHDGREFRMSFDYRLRPGVATSRNALALMRLIGLASADEIDGRNFVPASGV